MGKDKALTPQRRRELLAEAFALHAELEVLEVNYETAPDDKAETTAQRLDDALARLAEIHAQYLTAVPTVPVSRCPFCDGVLLYCVDTAGLDGLWWDSRQPVRREPAEDLDPHFLALTGAVDLGQTTREPAAPVPVTPMLVEPGPEVPFVVPRLFVHEDVQAVVSSLRIGGLPAYAIVYYADPVPAEAVRANTWGSDRYEYRTPDGEVKWGHADDLDEDYDFDLARWIADGRARWIAPDDESMTLRDEPEGCPYLGLGGRREILCVQDGRVWGLSDLEGRQA